MLQAVVLLFATAFLPQPQAPRAEAEKHTWDADVHRGYGRFAEAEADYRQALAVDPRHVRARRGLGLVLDLRGRHAEAQRHFETALESADSGLRMGILGDLAVSFAFVRRFDEARKTLDGLAAALARRGHPDGTLSRRFDMAIAEGNLEEAERLARGIYDRDQTALATETGRGGPLAALPLATAQHEQAARLAVILARRGQREAALEQLKRIQAALSSVFSTMPGFTAEWIDEIPAYAVPAGEVAYLLGDDVRSIQLLSRTALVTPAARLTLGQAYERAGDRAKARDQYRAVVENRVHGLELALARPVAEARLAALPR